MTRSEVYKLVHGERDYQASLWHWDGHGCGIYLTYMDHYLREAVDGKSKMDACRDKHWFHAGAAIRKFAALAVAAMEENGLLYPSEPPARDWVYAAIDEEYQRCQPSWPILRPPQEFPEELTLLRHYLRLAEAAWTTETDDSAVLNVILKLAVIAVRCLETYGAPTRSRKVELSGSNS